MWSVLSHSAGSVLSWLALFAGVVLIAPLALDEPAERLERSRSYLSREEQTVRLLEREVDELRRTNQAVASDPIYRDEWLRREWAIELPPDVEKIHLKDDLHLSPRFLRGVPELDREPESGATQAHATPTRNATPYQEVGGSGSETVRRDNKAAQDAANEDAAQELSPTSNSPPLIPILRRIQELIPYPRIAIGVLLAIGICWPMVRFPQRRRRTAGPGFFSRYTYSE